MGELFKKFGHLLVMALIAYYCWSATDAAGGKKNEKKEDRPTVTKAGLENWEEPRPAPRDVFQIDWSRYGPEYDPDLIARRKKAAEEARQARIMADARAKKERILAAQLEEERRRNARVFTLRLDSLLRHAGGVVASVSGRAVVEGDVLDGLDDEHPPVVTTIGDDSITVSYRGEEHVLDLLHRPSVRLSTYVPATAAVENATPEEPR